MSDLAPGLDKENALRNGGFNDQEVIDWKAQTTDSLYKGGFSQREVQDYFGKKDPDTSAMKDYVKTNLSAEAEKEKNSTSTAPKEAKSYLDAFMSGLQLSTAGLAINQKAPDMILPEHADRAMSILNMMGTVAGDIPAMIGGGIIGGVMGAPAGGAAGSVVPGIGTLGGIGLGATAGAAGGATALPATLRKIMMDHYQKGDITSSGEFFNRLAATTWEATKNFGIGVFTMGAGKVAAPMGTLASTAAEVATMTTVGAAMEGKLPEPDDFINGGIILAGLHGAGKVAGKLRSVYTATGEVPSGTVESANQDVLTRQQLLSDNPNEPIPDPKYGTVDLAKKLPALEGISEDSLPTKLPVEKTETKVEKPSTWGEVYRQTIDDLDPVKSAVEKLSNGEDVSPGSDPYKLMRTYKDYQGKVLRAYKFNTIDFKTGEANGEGLEPILKKVPNIEGEGLSESQSKVLESVTEADRKDRGESWGGLTSYLLSKRAIEKSGQGIETGIDLDAAKKVVADHGAQYEQVAKDLQGFQKRMKQYAVDSGVLSKEASKAIDAMNENYIPFYRAMEEDAGGAGGGASGNPFKKMVGSQREILDPIASVYKNTQVLFRVAEKNRATKSLVDLAEKAGDNDLIEKVKAEQRPVEVKKQELEKALREQGIDDPTGAAEAFTIFRPEQNELRPNEFQVFRDGKREVYAARPDLAESVKALDYHPGITNLWYKTFVKGPATLLRRGVTLAPEFLQRNFFRDQMTATILSEHKQIPFVDALQSIGHIWKEDKVWQEFLSSGGASGSFGEVSRLMKDDLWGVQKNAGVTDKVWNLVKTPVHALAVLSELTENIPRLTEFRKGGGVGGSFDEKIDAAMNSRDVTVDFAKAGAKIRAVSAIIPFLNVGIQGPTRELGAMFTGENKARTWAKATAMITLPTVLNWWANKDDSRYNDAPNWEKDLFWVMPTDRWEKSSYGDAMSRPGDLRRQSSDGSWEVNNGAVFRIPKPFVFGTLFGSLPERALSAFYKSDPDKFKSFSDTIIAGLVPNIMPTAILPAVEQGVNKSFFTGNQVVSSQVEKYMPEYQYTEYTSETAKQLGKIIGFVPGLRDIGPKNAKLNSPMVVDNWIRDWTGTTGGYAVQLIDKSLHAAGIGDQAPKPVSTLADIPAVKAFVMRYPQAKLQPIQDFRDNFDQTSKVVNTIQMLAKGGDWNAANKLMKSEQDSFFKMGSINQAISNQNSMIQKINKDPKMSPNDKRQLIDSLYFQMNQTAKMGNELLKSYRKSLDVAN